MMFALFMVGCRDIPALPAVTTPYKMDIQQGNVVTQDMISKLQPGMTRSQVRFALGTPLIVDPFRTDRWDYVFLYQKAGVVTEHRKIAVIFKDDKLVRIEGDVVPAPKQAPREAGQEKSGGANPEVRKPPEPKPAAEKPAEERGFFGRMLERLGL